MVASSYQDEGNVQTRFWTLQMIKTDEGKKPENKKHGRPNKNALTDIDENQVQNLLKSPGLF